MTETEAIRQNYNLGVLAGEAREQERIIKLLEEGSELESSNYVFSQIISDMEFKLPDGNDVVEVNYAWAAFNKQLEKLIALIKGEK